MSDIDEIYKIGCKFKPTPFEHFFHHDFDIMLDKVESSGDIHLNGIPIQECSWDRKAAYLLWCALGLDKK